MKNFNWNIVLKIVYVLLIFGALFFVYRFIKGFFSSSWSGENIVDNAINNVMGLFPQATDDKELEKMVDELILRGEIDPGFFGRDFVVRTAIRLRNSGKNAFQIEKEIRNLFKLNT